jgi:putative phosphoribosyl transferase
MAVPFKNRADAGRQLAGKLTRYAGARESAMVLGLARGGVPVAFEVAAALRASLDVFLVRKLGVPGHEELAMGAIATGGVRVLNREVIEELGIAEATIEQVAEREQRELERREREYREGQPPPEVRGRIVVLVDDGLATGSTMRAAARAVRQRQPLRVVVAAPVGAPQTCSEIATDADEVTCLYTPPQFHAVGLWYEDFSQTTDEEIRQLLAGRTLR